MSGEGFAQAAIRLALEVHVRGGKRPLVVSVEAARRDLRSHIVKATGARGRNVWLEMLRLRAEATVARWVPGRSASGGKRLPPRKGERSIHWERAKPTDTVLYDRFALAPAHRIVGPALIEGDDTTYPVPPGWTATVDAYGNFVIERTR
jgi:N-methylhydantoinase A/oxoprolinase/acetone carboxylase beta subunit